MRCIFHGDYESDTLPANCPMCLAAMGKVTLMCENHGIQAVKPGNSCGHCVQEQLIDGPVNRVFGREQAPIISYFQPKLTRRKFK